MAHSTGPASTRYSAASRKDTQWSLSFCSRTCGCPGARTVDVMNYATDADLFAAWAHAVTHGRIPQPVERRHNAASVFKRACGVGRITHYEGLEALLAE